MPRVATRRAHASTGAGTVLRPATPLLAALLVLTACVAHPPRSATAVPGFPSIVLDTHDAAALQYGFTAVDVTPAELATAPAGLHALVWLGGYDDATCGWLRSDTDLRADFRSYRLAADRRVVGYFLADEPNTDRRCPGASMQLRARAALVRSLDPDPARYTLANIDDPEQFASFRGTVDVIATDPYPCRVGAACDWALIPSYIARLEAAGVTRYMGFLQAFSAGPWRWPTPEELRRMIEQWQRSRWCGAITFAWSYDGQDLDRRPGLLAVLREFNAQPTGAAASCGGTA